MPRVYIAEILLSIQLINNADYSEQGADFSAQNADGRTALHLACALGDLRIVRYLLLNGASVHIKDQ